MKVVVLAGGVSTERDVSLSSGTMIYHAIKKKHQAIMLDVYFGYEGEDYKNVFSMNREWAEAINPVREENPDIEVIKAKRSKDVKGFFGPHVIDICQEADLVFMALHGENGENGKIQAAFDLLGIAYTGTDYISSAMAMDKVITKELFFHNKVATPGSIAIKETDTDLFEKVSDMSYPMVVKTSCGGSSIGVYIVADKKELEESVLEAKKYGSDILVEEYVKGREFSVGVIDGKALPIIEIVPKVGFYDYKNKYQAGSTDEICPAQLDDGITKRMQEIAEQVFRVLRLKVYARMDFMLNEAGEPFCIEANTLPGMTPTSLLPQEAQAMGMSFEDLCEKIMELSLLK